MGVFGNIPYSFLIADLINQLNDNNTRSMSSNRIENPLPCVLLSPNSGESNIEKTRKYKAIGGHIKLTINIITPNVATSTNMGITLVIAKPTMQPIRIMPIIIITRLMSICLTPLATVYRLLVERIVPTGQNEKNESPMLSS